MTVKCLIKMKQSKYIFHIKGFGLVQLFVRGYKWCGHLPAIVNKTGDILQEQYAGVTCWCNITLTKHHKKTCNFLIYASRTQCLLLSMWAQQHMKINGESLAITLTYQAPIDHACRPYIHCLFSFCSLLSHNMAVYWGSRSKRMTVYGHVHYFGWHTDSVFYVTLYRFMFAAEASIVNLVVHLT